MRCEDARIWLSTRRDLSGSQRAELDAHLASCRACAAARVDEERVTRLLALLPSPNLAPPPRVAAAVRGMVARRSDAARVRKNLALAAGLGLLALVVAALANIVSGGLLFGGPREASTAAQPGDATGGSATDAAAALPADELVYLVVRNGSALARLDAWSPTDAERRFTLSLGDPPVMLMRSQNPPNGVVEFQLPPRDITLSPDGATIYLVEFGDGGAVLVAYDAHSGAERWRRPLTGITPYTSFDFAGSVKSGSLSVSPDGAVVFVRATATVNQDPTVPPDSFVLQAYSALDGRPLGEPTALADGSTVLPLSRDAVLAYNLNDLPTIVTLGSHEPPRFFEQPLASAVLLPDGGVRAVTPDLKVLDLAVAESALILRTEDDLIERGGYFFDHAAFSPDGQVLAVGKELWDSASGEVKADVRIFKAGPWREVERYTINRPFTQLAVSADGARVYVALGPLNSYRWVGVNVPEPTPTRAPDSSPPRDALAIFDVANKRLIALQELDQDVVGLLAGR